MESRILIQCMTYMYFKLMCWMYLDDESPIDSVGVILYVSLFQA